MAGKVRIIGGRWRGRKIPVPDYAELRPSPDRVRETLFNWLKTAIEGANCLDLFAGTGVLGFEALSRGAASVTMIERNKASVEMLKRHANALEAEHLNIFCEDADGYLARSNEKFDIVFLDPPFSKNILERTCETLLNRGHLRPGALVYLESDSEIKISSPHVVVKKASAGNVHFELVKGCFGGET